ncbi:DUF1697 domain-containing protein [Paenibacillus sp. H1-7]|uniref:DUF1697 domain-containing protein n=1 Tax=Paenibacillus sp. H1-7 TaxID=2282849 RepID=UPI001EF8374D|nr:DUF1697 domain-containing protein [Paenibacillus sp. H1-7]ULL18517.1 DUF1697 domain-containing protein [Paenibacillus sp. H1-7]
MTTYIALLRGINVSGQKLIKMDSLKAMFEAMSFRRVRTYIQSGNVIFESDDNAAERLVKAIEAEIARVYGFDVAVILRTEEELEGVIKRNPFASEQLVEGEKVYVSLLSQEPSPEAIGQLQAYSNDIDEYRIIGREVYILCRKSYGKSQFSNNFLEKKLRVSATTRNWESVNKIAEIARS